MVMNLLQTHSLDQARDLVERSFGQYLADLNLAPQIQNLELVIEQIAKLENDLANVDLKQLEVSNSARVNEDLFLMDKRAEFEALDLAINTRRKQLIDLELLKNHKLNEDSMLSDENSVSFLQVITCLL